MQILDPLAIKLYGKNIIEASAGTGKTYAITIMYLRLLLGMRKQPFHYSPLNIKKILLVTFTNLAIAELKNKIKQNIYQFRMACIKGYSENNLFSKLISQIDDIKWTVAQLLNAESNIDQASIYTIHGFCKSIINKYPIETGTLINQPLLENELLIHNKIFEDFWRKYFYPLPLEIINIIYGYWSNPKKFQKEILACLQGNTTKIRYPFYQNETIIDHHIRIINFIKKIKYQWKQTYNVIEDKYIKNLQINNKLLNIYKKINMWAEMTTINYEIPKELVNIENILKSITNLDKTSSLYKLLNTLKEFHYYSPCLKTYILIMAMNKIPNMLAKEKKIQEKISLDDLISILELSLYKQSNIRLISLIRNDYPVAIIDEFQDTDFKQYNIFNLLYNDEKNCSLFLIGDPKQAIYTFRGANIFAYIKAYKNIQHRWTMNTNWRASSDLVNVVNRLFLLKDNPFILKNIKFVPVNSTPCNDSLKLIINNKKQPAMSLWLYPKNSVHINDYQKFMAQQCAMTIYNLVNHIKQNDILLQDKKSSKLLKMSDMIIIVRDRFESSLMHSVLKDFGIPNICYTNTKNIFYTLEAQELLYILQAILILKNTYTLNNALSTNLLGYSAKTIDKINKENNLLEDIIEKFSKYKFIWETYGISIMIQQVIEDFLIKDNLLINTYDERTLFNVLHLKELLQEMSFKLPSKYALIHWLSTQIKFSNLYDVSQKIQPTSLIDSIKIITIHKSKGLEFPIVFLPFIANFKKQHSFFHNQQTYEKYLNLTKDPEKIILAEQERLSEDMRLLYVAITRAICQCHIGIGPIFHGHRKLTGISDLHHSAIGYLIQQGVPANAQEFRNKLDILIENSKKNIALHPILSIKISEYKKQREKILFVKKNKISIQYNWKITSYTELKETKNGLDKQQSIIPLNQQIKENNQEEHKILTQHTFPKGYLIGRFLHKILAKINFNKTVDIKFLLYHMTRDNIDEVWLTTLQQWLENILNIPLNHDNLVLKTLKSDQICTELEFHLSINTISTNNKINKLLQYYDDILLNHNNNVFLNFPDMQGMLKGYIDLVFCWKKKYYLLDYKSNWLGPNSSDYTLPAIEKEIVKHNYALQYNIYTLALHRFLKSKIYDYNYQNYFGGVFYFFLRGIEKDKIGNGIYFCLPKYNLINKLDKLLTY